jgi:hypothetical protein
MNFVLISVTLFLPAVEGFISNTNVRGCRNPILSISSRPLLILKSGNDQIDLSLQNYTNIQQNDVSLEQDNGVELMNQMTGQDDPFQATGKEELIRTLAGGPALIFEMARKSMLFVREADASTAAANSGETNGSTKRWYPYSGVQENNPSFRTQPPVMSNQAFAKTIWRNVRKRKQGYWRHALRTYDRMSILEKDHNFPHIQRSNTHHEGAMLACAKLGLWQRALEIFHCVYQLQLEAQNTTAAFASTGQVNGVATSAKQSQAIRSRNGDSTKRKKVSVTDDMVLSLVKACVRSSQFRSRHHRKQTEDEENLGPLPPEIEEREAILRRIPLDTAMEVLSTLPKEHGIPLMAHFVNPLASAYQSLGYIQQARDMLQIMLSNRTAGEDEIFNVNDLHAKDKGSYSLLVQGAVVTGDWGLAVEALGDMTKAGLYPNSRHCNLWSEISERQTRPRAVGSWKKKRDDIWTDSVR